MKILALARRAFIIGAALALLAGCGGSQQIGAPGAMSRAIIQHDARGGPWMLPEAKSDSLRKEYKATQPLLYVTNLDVSYPNVRIYRAKAKDPAPLATISNGVNIPFGACIDGQGTLYVTNEPSNGPGWISVYSLGKTTPSRTITKGINTPGFCAIDGSGNLWVTNIGGRNVTEYLQGSKKPHTVITSGLYYPIGVAIDHGGNLYVGNGFGASQQNVQVYSPGSNSPSRTISNGVTSPCGLTVDSNGTLYVANEFQSNVAEYRSGEDVPFQTITQAIKGPGGVTVDKKDRLYVSNIGGSTVVEFALGSLTPLKRQISKGLYNPVGIAYYPPLRP